MAADFVSHAKERMAKAVAHCRDEMVHIRTGKATPALLDPIRVDYFGSHVPLKQVAGISTPEPRLLVIQPYDKGMIGAIEKAVLASDLGLTPSNDGRMVRLPIPVLTTERREELIKVVRRIAEEGRVTVRNHRRDLNEAVKKAEKSSEISEDVSRHFHELIQKETDHHISEIDHLLKIREEEIRKE
ncbi:MAG: ribosome recycling factor [Calditrichaeota bacterium]|nr:ribosome recycling factor [Calditrichota bacterium]